MVSLSSLLLALYSPYLVLGFSFFAEPGTKLDARYLEDVSARIRSRNPDPALLNLLPGLESIGGGLLNGVLQPLTGILAGIDVPIPQPNSLIEIPGDDPKHQYQPPGPTDVRGPCVAANTMANHGYINRTGITTFAEAANACQIAMGLDYTGCVAVSILGLITGGDLLTGKFSIGGQDSRVPNTLGTSLGASKHGFFESDGSITRVDAALGNQASFNLPRWHRLLAIAKKHSGLFNEPTFAEERVVVYDEGVATNPQFNAGPRGTVVAALVRALVARNLPNGTTPNLPDYASIAPFYLNETFPENWYRHSPPLTVVELAISAVEILTIDGSILKTPLGQNEGVNNFIPSGVDMSNLTPQQFICALLQVITDVTPGVVSPVVAKNFGLVESLLNAVLLPLFASYDCPLTIYVAPGPSAGDPTPGVSAPQKALVNGVYQ